MQNGITGGGSGGSALGDVASLGVTLGAMGSVIGMTKDALNPIANGASEIGQTVGGAIAPAADGWNCSCGQNNITSKFCPECGAKKPEATVAGAWNCSCGATGITSKFCPECGAKRPEPTVPDTWDCSCGKTGITSNFCPDCGKRKGEK